MEKRIGINDELIYKVGDIIYLKEKYMVEKTNVKWLILKIYPTGNDTFQAKAYNLKTKAILNIFLSKDSPHYFELF